jgi:hypothetical protein
MNSLATTLKLLPDKQNIDRMTLSRVLKVMGLPTEPYQQKQGLYRQNYKRGTYNLHKIDNYGMQDLFDRAHQWWLEGCKVIQTQFVENHEMAARWNSLWQRIKELFRKRGLGMN